MTENSPLEVRRQAFHIGLGLLSIFAITSELVDWKFFLILLIVGIPISIISKKRELPAIAWLLKYFDRKNEIIPGKGALFFIAGVMLALVLFEKDIALAAIMILTLGDSISHLFGRFFGKVKHPWNQYKLIEGTLLGFVAGAVGAAAFVPWNQALLASAVAMIVEGIELRFRNHSVDDNILIPLVAGIVMLIMRL